MLVSCAEWPLTSAGKMDLDITSELCLYCIVMRADPSGANMMTPPDVSCDVLSDQRSGEC